MTLYHLPLLQELGVEKLCCYGNHYMYMYPQVYPADTMGGELRYSKYMYLHM